LPPRDDVPSRTPCVPGTRRAERHPSYRRTLFSNAPRSARGGRIA
jgi:hypothetical protein